MHMRAQSAAPTGFNPGGTLTRLYSTQPRSYDEATRTAVFVLSSGTAVTRWGMVEQLAVTEASVDLGRVTAGQVRLLDSHNWDSLDRVLGSVEAAWIENGQLVGRIRFGDSEQGRKAEQMVQSGDAPGVSIGYAVRQWTLVGVDASTDLETWRADSWELLEVSLVAVPADPTARVRHMETAVSPATHEEDMTRQQQPAAGAVPAETNAAPAAIDTRQPPVPTQSTAIDTRQAPVPTRPAAIDTEQRSQGAEDRTVTAPSPAAAADNAAQHHERAADILAIGTRAGLPPAEIENALRAGTNVEAFRARAFDHLVGQANATRTDATHVIRDEGDTRRRAMIEGLAVGMAGPAALSVRGENGTITRRDLFEPARRYNAFYDVVEFACEILGERRQPRSWAEREDVMRRAMHATSDFPIIFEGALNTVLQARYALAQPTYRRIARQRNFVDFRPHPVVRAGDFPQLQPVGEGGEIKSGTFSEGKESVSVAPYAVRVDISRQMLINDRLNAIGQVLGSYGDRVATFEEQVFYAMKGVGSGAGPTLITDSQRVFASPHGNLAASGTAITVAALGAARAALRKIKSLDGMSLNVAGTMILVGPDKETEAQQITASIQPVVVGEVNPFSGRLDIVTSAEITGNAWEVYADPGVVANWQWGYLDGFTGPRMRIETPFGIQGTSVSVEHDFGCGAIDFRAAYRNPGN